MFIRLVPFTSASRQRCFSCVPVTMFALTTILAFTCCHSAISNDDNHQLHVALEAKENHRLILHCNVTSNHSYRLSIRSFGGEEQQLGLFTPADSSPIEILYPNASTADLFIVCCYFILLDRHIDVQCKDIRLPNSNRTAAESTRSPSSYKPLFVPMMYALSVLMILPVIIQHRHRKRALVKERRKQIRRLSINIAQDNPGLLPQIIAAQCLDRTLVPFEFQLLSFPSYDTRQSNDFSVTADDCVAHLLDNAPWNSSSPGKATLNRVPKRTSSVGIKAKHVSIGSTNYDPPSARSKPSNHFTLNMYRSNPAFVESDV